jgi:hypothetical protein
MTPVRGKWLRYLLCGLGLVGSVVALPLGFGLALGSLAFLAAYVTALKSANAYVNQRAEPGKSRFCARLLGLALLLVVAGGAVIIFAAFVHGLREP